jgi:hypothetical protein
MTVIPGMQKEMFCTQDRHRKAVESNTLGQLHDHLPRIGPAFIRRRDQRDILSYLPDVVSPQNTAPFVYGSRWLTCLFELITLSAAH